MTNKIPVYVLNDFLKFERKLYSLFGMNLGRAIQFKTIIYFGAAATTLFVLSLLPLFGPLIRSTPPVMLLMLLAGSAYLLTDVGTENRPPLNAFISFVRYHWLAMKKESYYKGKVFAAQRPIKFVRLATVREPRFVNRANKKGS